MDKKSTVHKFIDKERDKGLTDQKIRHQLLDAGWQMDIINRAMIGEETNTPEVSKKKPRPDWRKYLFAPLSLGLALVILVLLAIFI